MSQILICEGSAVLRQRLTEAFAQAAFSAEDAERALAAWRDAFAPSRTVVLSLGHSLRGLSGLEAHVLSMDSYWERGHNHPDGWYRMFYSDTAFYKPKVNLDTRYRVQSAFKTRQIARSSDRRVDNKNYARFLSSHSRVV